ncbi:MULTISPECIES: hypothetical protein [unclassified Streptomyces]|uniref:hypothetical protein n=1 Tax=unclassified Streptomyces TaxID=2593676 RepID=UPI002E29639A|nr:hypothetical protein [Streptomyces sp. NBC_01439]
MTATGTEWADTLEPARAELLRVAHEAADSLLAEAAEDARRTLASGSDKAAATLERARRQGRADGAAFAAGEVVRARRRAYALELQARKEVYEDLRRRVIDGVLHAPTDHAALRARLEARARDLLGPGASVTAVADGGVLAEAPGRRVDLTLTSLAERALERAGPEAETLWAP